MQVITSAKFHPQHCHIFAYSSSKGSIRLSDMRDRALCDKHAKAFEEETDGNGNKSFFSEIIASISDINFAREVRLLRDLVTKLVVLALLLMFYSASLRLPLCCLSCCMI